MPNHVLRLGGPPVLFGPYHQGRHGLNTVP
jgi:hypothetical protein